MSNQHPQAQLQPVPPSGWAPEHPQGTIILVLGILGFVTGVTGVVAWVLGSKARKEIRASATPFSNAQNVEIGWICGIVSSLLTALAVVFVIGYFVVFLIFFGTMMANMPR